MPLKIAIAVLLAGLLGASPGALAQVARVLDVKGTSIVGRSGMPSRILGPGEQLDERDVISVARDSYAILEFRDQTRITLRPNTVFRLDSYRDTALESMLFGLVKGGFRAVTGLIGKANPKAVRFTTATATIGIRGTEFDARLCEDDCAEEERRSTRTGFPVAARLIDLKGSVVGVNVEGVERKLVPGSYVRQFDEVRTASGSHAVLLLRDGGRLVVHPDTRIGIQRFKYEPARPADAEVELMLYAGRIGTQTGLIGKSRSVGYTISTRVARLSTRGTTAEVRCTGTCAETAQAAAGGQAGQSRGRSGSTTQEHTKPPAGTGESPTTLNLARRQAQPPAQSSTPVDESGGDWRTQAISEQAKQAIYAYLQQQGLSPSELAAMQSALYQNPPPTYAQLQQGLAAAGPSVAWARSLAEMFAGAGNAGALVGAVNAYVANASSAVAWRDQGISDQTKQALYAYAQQSGASSSELFGLQSLLSQSPPLTYARLQQLLAQEANVPWVGPLVAMFAGAGNAAALNATLSLPPNWRDQTISEQARQAFYAYAQQAGASPSELIGLQALLNQSPPLTYARLQQMLAWEANTPWVGSLVAMFAGAGNAGALVGAVNAYVANASSAVAWRDQGISDQTKQALYAYAQQSGASSSELFGLQSLLSQSPPLTYARLQQMLAQEANTPWVGPLVAMFAGAGNADALNATLSLPPNWRDQTISEQARQAFYAYAQQAGASPSELIGLQALLNQSPPLTYARLQQMLAWEANTPWVGSLVAMFAGAGNAGALVGAVNAYVANASSAVAWRDQGISDQTKQALYAYAQQSGASSSELFGLQSLLSQSPPLTYARLQQMLAQEANTPWVGPLVAMFAGAGNADALNATLSLPPNWRDQTISEQARQAFYAYAQQAGASPSELIGLQALLNQSPPLTYAQLQQGLAAAGPSVAWARSLAEMFAGAGNAGALVGAVNAYVANASSAVAWRDQGISDQTKQALYAYAQQSGASSSELFGLQSLLSQSPPLTYARLQQMLAQEANTPWVGPLVAMFAGAGNADALNATLNSTAAQTPVTSGMEISVTEGAVEVTTPSGTQVVTQGQFARVSGSGLPLLMATLKMPADSAVPNPRMPGIDSGGTFGDEPPASQAHGLYVWVREGVVQIAKDSQAVDVAAGGAAVATPDRVVLLDAVPNFMRFDSTPRPLPAGGVRVADAFIAPDGSQSLMCIVR